MRSGSEAVGQIITDDRQTIVEVNDRLVEMVQRDRSELIGAKALSFTFGADLAHNAPLLDALVQDGSAFAIRKRYVRGDGQVVWVENHVSALTGPSGRRIVCATSRLTRRPFGVEALANRHRVARRLCSLVSEGRKVLGGDVVSLPAAETLLILYRAEIEGEALDLERIAERTRTPVTVLLRWMRLLVERGLVHVENEVPLCPRAAIRISRTGETILDGLLAGPV